ncbi:MAG: divalent metal cation transporter [Planctomycetota bacterium]|nr:divalent metal cation transporter [Planctomycetota bacterium]
MSQVEQDRQAILEAKQKGGLATLLAYARLSGPGWLQGAITLGGGSLAGSLYLGVIGGYEMMWLQPLMMILGIVMLSAIGYVALSTGERPFDAINRHVNPVLGWGWAIATLMANLVWAMPQFSLGTAAIQQNLFPELFGGDAGKYIAVGLLFGVSAVVIWFYESGGWGLKLFEILLKSMVAIVVLSFFGVVIAMSSKGGGLAWGEILAGFVPDLSLLDRPAAAFEAALAESTHAEFWREQILSTQRDRMVTAAATAVGINMTFLLPYSMLKRGWDRDFRGLAIFDLSVGLFIPFLLATSCVVSASASQFHGQFDPGLVGEGPATPGITDKLQAGYDKNVAGLKKTLAGTEEVDLADKKIAAMLVQRDAFLLANTLEKLTGPTVAHVVFGIGVVGMAFSTIIILMLINGFTVCEMMGIPASGIQHRIFSLLPGVTGALGFLFLWGDGEARFWLAVPTSVFGMVLLPIAYLTFFLMMNNRRMLGDHMPQGGRRNLINVAMCVALGAATVGAGWAIWSKAHWYGVGGVAAFLVLVGVVQVVRGGGPRDEPTGSPNLPTSSPETSSGLSDSEEA